MSQVVVWSPQPGPQEMFVSCPIPDVFYGGARGGGKSDGLLGDYLGHAGRHGKNARGILVRRTLRELSELIERSRAIYAPLGWKFKGAEGQQGKWTAPNGATLVMTYLDNDNDAEKFQGHSYTWIGIDELGNFPSPKPIDKLWGTLRSAAGVPCVMRSTGNPGGPGHGWVKKRYIDVGPYVVHEDQPLKSRPDLKVQRVFIPSTLDDNKILQQNDPLYEARLAATGGEALFKAWRQGDWNILAGQYFDIFDENTHVVRRGDGLSPRTYTLEPWHPKWLSMDWGYHDDSVAHWHRSDEQKKVVTYREYATSQTTPEDLGRALVRACTPGEHLDAFYLSRDAFHKRNSERTIADEIYEGIQKECAVLRAEDKMPPSIPRPSKADDDRVGGWMLMYQMLANGNWRIDASCVVLIECLPLLIRDTREGKNPEDCMDSMFDHAPDSARYGLKTRLRANLNTQLDEALTRAGQIVDLTQRHIAVLAAQEMASRRGVGVRCRRYR